MSEGAGPAKLGGYELFRALGSPRYVVAPMVDQSELPWRQLCRRYGAQLCYTPMINAGVFLRCAAYREATFTTCPEDRPLIAQLAGHDPQVEEEEEDDDDDDEGEEKDKYSMEERKRKQMGGEECRGNVG